MRISRIVPALGLALASLLTACSGPAGGVLPASQPGSADAAHGSLVVRVRIPHEAKVRRVRVLRAGRPEYISASTKGMTIAITGPTAVSKTIALTPGSPNCKNATCTISIPGLDPCAKTNCYTTTIATYDKVACTATCSIPAGANELSNADGVPFTIVAGKANHIGFTLNGIVARFSIALPSSQDIESGQFGVMVMFGAAPHTLTVAPLDADGNQIVGPGAPSIVASSASSSLGVSQSPSNPDAVTVQPVTTGSPPVVTPGVSSFKLTANPTAPGGQPTTQTVPAGILHSAVYATVYDTSLSQYSVDVFLDGNATVTPNERIAGSNTGLNSPAGIAVDANGTMYVAVPNSHEILEFAAGASGNVPPTATISGSNTYLDYPEGLSFDPNTNRLWVANNSTPIAGVEAFTLPASGNVFAGFLIAGSQTALNNPTDVDTDALGDVFVSNSGDPSILVFVGQGNVAPVATIAGANTGLAGPTGIAVAGGRIYATNYTQTSSLLNKFSVTDSGNIGSAETLTGGGGASITGIAVDLAGNMWIGDASTINEYAAGSSGGAAPIATIPKQASWVAVVPAAPK